MPRPPVPGRKRQPTRAPGSTAAGAGGARKRSAKPPAATAGTARRAGAPRPDAPRKRVGAGERADRPERADRSSKAGAGSGGARKRSGARPGAPDRRPPQNVDRPGWGGVARRGARSVVARPDPDAAKRPSREPERSAPEPWQPDEWVRDEEVRDTAAGAVDRGDQGAPRPSTPRRRAPAPVAAEVSKAVGERRAAKVEQRLVEAARAFERGRAQDAWRIVRPLAEEAPGAAAVRELAGLSLYRLGRWKPAIAHLEAFVKLTGSVEQHPVLADCYRAVGRHAKVQALWEELREASPGAELVTEGRIVMAGSLADRGELRKAISLLERGPVSPRRPAVHHLRLWYALADLYERVGDAPRARELFARIAAVDPDLADTAERLSTLS